MNLKIMRICLIVLVAASVALLSGCVTKKEFRTSVKDQDDKIQTVQGGVEANERRISELRTETKAEVVRLDGKADSAMATGKEALTKAELAEKLAKGKLIYEVTLSNDAVKFGFNQATLSDEAKNVLDDLAGKVKAQNKALYVEIQGHTDSIGSEDYNMKLGEKRAEAVRRYMNEVQGIPLHAISAVSYGESKPVADNDTKDGRNANRRVVIRVLE
jgi:outer membrane protein OmpA-like peptidoglycan-associated protein